MPSTVRPRFLELLRLLAQHRVEHIVVGGVAAVLQGAPITTFDADIVHARTPENVDRLLGLLTAIDAVYRNDARKLRPKASHLVGPGHQLLTTTLGDLDCLGTIGLPGHELSHADLLPETRVLELGDGLQCRVLLLAKLITVKREAGRPKDVAVLPILAAALEEERQRAR